MKKRVLGKTGFEITEVAIGTWQLGGRWGEPFDEENAMATLNRAADLGINFFDTADVYGNRLSERAIGKYFKKFPEDQLADVLLEEIEKYEKQWKLKS